MRVLWVALILYFVVMIGIVLVKPKLIYNHETKQYRPFGTAPGATLLPVWLLALVIAVGAYTITSISLSYPSIAALLPFGSASSVPTILDTDKSTNDTNVSASTSSMPSSFPPRPFASKNEPLEQSYEYRPYPPNSPLTSLYDQLNYEREYNDNLYSAQSPINRHVHQMPHTNAPVYINEYMSHPHHHHPSQHPHMHPPMHMHAHAMGGGGGGHAQYSGASKDSRHKSSHYPRKSADVVGRSRVWRNR